MPAMTKLTRRVRHRPPEGGKVGARRDVIVHSTIHPVLGPDSTSGFPPLLFYRQSATSDLGAMAKRAGVRYLMLTHLIHP